MRAAVVIALVLALVAPAAARNRAAIDVGSSSIKLLVVSAKGKVLADVKVGAGLGKHIGSDGTLPEKNRKRALKALEQLIDRAAEYGVKPKHIEVIATAAVRNAKNGRRFVEHDLIKGLGLKRARILSGHEEATLGLRGALKGWRGNPDGKLVVVDIGGGSHQVIEVGSTQVGSHQVAERVLEGDDLALADRRMKKAVPELPISRGRAETTLLIGGTAKFLHHYFRRDAMSRVDVEALRLKAVSTGAPVKHDVDGHRFSKREREMLGLQKNGGKNAASLAAKLTLVLRLMNLLDARTLHVTDTDARHALVE
jgi:exopolyphosphatase/guanosine-5'-triphosphate,3'-diphosphate pyrophosphatase